MVNRALFVRLVAKPGKEEDVANFLRGALPLVQQETGTTAWFALQFDISTFAIFDVFPDDAARQAHLAGQVAQALVAKAPELFAGTPVIEDAAVLAAKLPQSGSRAQTPQPVAGEKIPLQVGSELLIRNNGEISVGNPEIELGLLQIAADAVLSYRYDAKAGQHHLRLLDPVADRGHMREHRPND
jgi:quinol monooxygenase YgiN